MILNKQMEDKPYNNNIRVRFAPSPTGFLHIGSARTAFFNWLFAQKNNGKFILRIEDTDIARHQEDTVNLIMNSLKWLGINWDEGPDIGGNYGPYRQSMRLNIYKEYAQKLLNEKNAYLCFCSPEVLKKKKEAALKAGKFYRYDRECLKLSRKDINQNLNSGMDYVIRFLVPDNKIINFNDTVYSQISIDTKIIEDFIIVRSNGLATYNYSAVVDDMLMKITHVIRGEDHLSNTPKQILIYNALNTQPPSFTHLPMILGQDGSKLSKRHGSISIESYRDEGFLSEAVLNYLALLGWSYGEKTNIFSKDDLIKKFNLNSINKKPAKFDYSKLLWLSGCYIRNSDNKILKKLIKERILKKINFKSDDTLIKSKENLDEKLDKIIPLVKERPKTLQECDSLISPFFFKIKYSTEIINYFKNKKISAPKILNGAISSLSGSTINSEDIEKSLRLLSEKLDINFRKIAEAIRIAIWASKVSPPLFGTIEILGKELTLKRLKNYKNLL